MVKIDDVASLAGVSKMTVSRVMNNKGYVKEETREKVTQAIDELKYRPNLIAKGLATRRSHTIAYVMVNISDPFHNLVSKGIESICYKRGFTTLVCDTHTKNRESDYINMLTDRQIDGAIFHHLDIMQEQVDVLEASGVKCVLLDNESKLENACSVRADNYLGARMAAEYLISIGHTKIACMHGIMEFPAYTPIEYEDTFQYNIWRNRTQGFLDVMKEKGLCTTNLFQGNGLDSLASEKAREVAREIFAEKDRVTALYCENDIMAVATLNALAEMHLSAPKDLAIVGHDGLELCRMLHPYITTIAQPRFEMGLQSVSILIDRIEGDTTIKNVILKPELNIGETA